MKKLVFPSIYLIFLLLFNFSCDSPSGAKEIPVSNPEVGREADATDATNDFYDNAESYNLPVSGIMIGGEVEHSVEIKLETLPLHSVIVKETLLDENGDSFVGAYRYDGYSLYDILNRTKVVKKNQEEFPPIIDLYVEVANEKGEKAVVSWGEIYYPNHLHEIIIASRVMRIVPSKTKDLWPLPTESKLVCTGDLITERNISSPKILNIRSASRSFTTVKGMSPVYSPSVSIYKEDSLILTLNKIPEETQPQTYHTIFYGRGRGIHSTQPFTGYMLKDIIGHHFVSVKENLQRGYFIIAAKDGYRGVFTFSEVMNRNDQAELLMIYAPEEEDGGAFRLFPAGDFFSDRAIKAVGEIYFSTSGQ